MMKDLFAQHWNESFSLDQLFRPEDMNHELIKSESFISRNLTEEPSLGYFFKNHLQINQRG